MSKFTNEERSGLYALFALDEHEIREGSTSKSTGKVQWFTYIRREAIQIRLDEFFFGEWDLQFLDPTTPAIYHKDHVDCSMRLSIRGIHREYNGSQAGGGENGAKGAATDALKRVASLWGIGLYLQNSPQIWTEGYKTSDGKIDYTKKRAVEAEAMAKVGAWLKSIGASGNALAPVETETVEETAKQAPSPLPSNTVANGVKSTGEIKLVEVRKDSKTEKLYLVLGGASLFTRDPLRKLGYSEEIIDSLGAKIGRVNLPDPVRMNYTEEEKNGVKTRKPTQLMRVSTGEIIDIS